MAADTFADLKMDDIRKLYKADNEVKLTKLGEIKNMYKILKSIYKRRNIITYMGLSRQLCK